MPGPRASIRHDAAIHSVNRALAERAFQRGERHVGHRPVSVSRRELDAVPEPREDVLEALLQARVFGEMEELLRDRRELRQHASVLESERVHLVGHIGNLERERMESREHHERVEAERHLERLDHRERAERLEQLERRRPETAPVPTIAVEAERRRWFDSRARRLGNP